MQYTKPAFCHGRWVLLLLVASIAVLASVGAPQNLPIPGALSEMSTPSIGGQREFRLSDYGPNADGITDDTPALQRCFADVAKAGGGTVVLNPGKYFMAGGSNIVLSSRTQVIATGATILLPKKLGDRARITLFKGENISDFIWVGGVFEGYCFDARRVENSWEPNVHTQIIFITTSSGGVTDRLHFKDIVSHGIAGAVVAVYGQPMLGSESGVDTFATNVTVENCTLINSGRFCWDYGYLWEILNWPEDYTSLQRGHAEAYFPKKLIREGVRFEADGDRVLLDNRERPISVSTADAPSQMICFFGGILPMNLKRGKAYYIVESAADHLKISEKFNGAVIRFKNVPTREVKVMHNMLEAYWILLAPTGSGDSVGAVDLRCCRNTRITGCKLSTLGDTTHIERCYGNVFAKNHITGSRMGALFLSSFCKQTDILDNVVEGTNGSRALSVEKSNEDVRVIGNIFRGAGRGNWINQPKNILIEGNTFSQNTSKGIKSPKLGRRTFVTGDYDSFAELYFTIYEPTGRYSGVIVRNNIFETGPEAQHAIGFQQNGSDIQVVSNTFRGSKRGVVVDPSCQNVAIRNNTEIGK